ncbi:uncharacterized protein LOC116416501 [Nasonia vitripennis]|uniref:Uncharacterized protein n=1 Tax=Nasonia vitripennis TaxID=7425 RepID=A0A7M7Q539_NASVI|nr:uncharacterized protein LOC116416501 [Nasonia vitripennis]
MFCSCGLDHLNDPRLQRARPMELPLPPFALTHNDETMATTSSEEEGFPLSWSPLAHSSALSDTSLDTSLVAAASLLEKALLEKSLLVGDSVSRLPSTKKEVPGKWALLERDLYLSSNSDLVLEELAKVCPLRQQSVPSSDDEEKENSPVRCPIPSADKKRAPRKRSPEGPCVRKVTRPAQVVGTKRRRLDFNEF